MYKEILNEFYSDITVYYDEVVIESEILMLENELDYTTNSLKREQIKNKIKYYNKDLVYKKELRLIEFVMKKFQ